MTSSIETGRGMQGGDMFQQNSDVLVKYVLEGHERGVNWASFHPTLPLIVSGSDDRQIKLWRMSDTKAWEVDTLRGHYNNVSCVIFHPRQELILSDSEDKSIRVWDMSKRSCIQSFRRESDRFWIMVAHPDLNLFAAGHDTGLIVFKLERERPAATVAGTSLFYIKDKFLRLYDFSTNTDVPVCGVKKPTGLVLNQQHRTLSYNPAEHALLATSNVEGGTYEVYSLPKQYGAPGSQGADVRDMSNDCRRGPGQQAVFVARNRYVVLNRPSQQLLIRNLNNDQSKSVNLQGNVSDVCYAGTGSVLLLGASSVVLFDLQNQEAQAEVQVSNIRYAYWNADMSLLSLVGKHTIVITNKKLEQLCLIHETIRIKSGVWDSDLGIFVYTTLNHIKYALPQGDHGIIKTLDHPLYVVRSNGKNLYCLDRDAKVRLLTIDPTEYRFKLALVHHKYDEVLNIIRNSNLVGQSIIAYLRQKGFPEVALQFVKDSATRFDLALECGNLQVGLEVAKELDKEPLWARLAQAALDQGNTTILESAQQRVKNFEKLSFLYLLTGQGDKLRKMSKIAEMRGDLMGKFHNSLYVGDVQEQAKTLLETGQYAMAYAMATRHGLTELAQKALEMAGRTDEDEAVKEMRSRLAGALLVPPVPIVKANAGESGGNWPLLPISKSVFEMGGSGGAPSSSAPANGVVPSAVPQQDRQANGGSALGGWGDGDDFDVPDEGPKSLAQVEASGVAVDALGGAEVGAGWDIDVDDLDIPDDVPTGVVGPSTAEGDDADEFGMGDGGASGTGAFVMPSLGPSLSENWTRNSALAVDHVAAGQFESAMQLLNRQVGVTHFGPLKDLFLSIYQCSRVAVPLSVGTQATLLPVHKNWDEADKKKLTPATLTTFSQLLAFLQNGYQLMTAGKFADAQDSFQKLLHQALLTAVTKPSEAEELKQMITVAREYLLAIRLLNARSEFKDAPEHQKRGLELAAYATHCELQPLHVVLCLNVAMAAAFKSKCFNTAASFARRVLDLDPPAPQAEKARKLLTVAERTPKDELALNYDPLNPFVICAGSLEPVYRGSPVVTSAYCGASYKEQFKGSVCVIDGVSRVGVVGTGLKSI